MKPKVSKEAIGLVVLLIAFVVVGLFASTPNESGDHRVGQELAADPSINNDRAHGSRALFEWTHKIGYRPTVERADWSNLPLNAHLLISVAPESEQGFNLTGGLNDGGDANGKLSQSDAIGVMRWLSGGRTLLLMTSRLPANGEVPDESAGDDDSSSDNRPTFGDVMGITVESTVHSNRTRFVPLQVSPLVAGVNSITLSTGGACIARSRRDFIPLFANVQPLHGDHALMEPEIAVIPVGKGRVIIVADDYFASNRNLSEADNAAFLANVITSSARVGSDVLFDEYHHGSINSSPDVWSAMGEPFRAAFWQIVLICVLIVAMTAPRFGAVRMAQRAEGRASGEYLTSLAGLYSRAEATVPALEIIYRQFLRDLCERLALPPGVSLELLADVAARHGKLNPNALKSLIAACELALDRKQLSSADLLNLTRQMEQVKRQIN
jgi:hypothetical protein